jgi:hypothetical protein
MILKRLARSFFLVALAASFSKDQPEYAEMQSWHPRPVVVIAHDAPGGVRFSNGDGEDPNGRAAFEYRKYIDPATGTIPDNIRLKELVYAGSLRPMDQLLRVSDTWNHRGPYNIGGRTRALAIKQSDGNVILAGGASGGMWRSSDGGLSWSKTTGVTDLHSATAIAEDLNTAGTWYYTTGEYKGNSAGGGHASYSGNGVYKSTDDGQTWTLLSSTASNTPQSFDDFFDYCWNVAVDPNTGYVYVATYGAIFRSTNGGSSFSVVLGGSSPYSAYTDISVVDDGSGTAMYAAMSTGAAQGVYRSTNGTTWTNIGSGSSFPASHGRAVLAVAPSDNNTVYILGHDGSSGDAVSNHFLWKYAYVSGDGSGAGGTWTDRSANLPSYGGSVGDFKSQYGYDLIVSVKPDDPDMVFVGGTNLYRSSDGFATADSGDPTLIDNVRWIGGYSTVNNVSKYTYHHPDIHSIAYDPSDPAIMYVGHDGGLSKTTDNTANGSGHEPVDWVFLNNGYMTTQFYSVAFHPADIQNTDTYYDFVMGGMQDNGTWGINSDNPADSWSELNSGDGGFCAIAADGTSYRSSQYGWIFRYGSPTATGSRTVIDPDYPSQGPGLFINPFELDPNDNSIMYNAYGGTIYRNDDVSGSNPTSTWAELTSVTSVVPADHKVTALAVSVSPSNIVYFGTTDLVQPYSSDLKLFRIDNAATGTSPTVTELSLTPGSSGAGVYVSCIAVDPADADNILVIFSNYATQSVFHSSDAGSNFANVSGNLEQNPDGSGNGPAVNWAAITHHPGLETYFVATSTGLYSTSSLNGTSTIWQQEGGNNLGNVVVDMVRIREDDGLVLVATHANGVYSFRPPATSDPEISFAAASQTVTEMTVSGPSGGACSGYRDYTVGMQISNPPSGDAIVTLAAAGSTTAEEGIDYDFTCNGDFDVPSYQLTFSDGSSASQSFTVRVYDDAAEEATDSIVFEYSISGSTDAISGSSRQMHIMRISDDDSAPLANETIVFLEEDFESGIGSWYTYEFGGHNPASPNSWQWGSAQSLLTSNSIYVSDDALGTVYDKTMSSDLGIRSPLINTTGHDDITLSFEYVCNGEVSTDRGYLGYQFNGDGMVYFFEAYQGAGSKTTRTLALPDTLHDAEFYLWWRWISNDSGGADPAFSVDDIRVSKVVVGSDIETHQLASKTEYLGPNAIVHFYCESSGELLASIENLGSHDYGCTQVVIESQGDTSRLSWNDGDTARLAAKTVRVLPATNNAAGLYNITLYFSAAEIDGWKTASGKDTSDLKIAKTSGSMANISPIDPGLHNVVAEASVAQFGTGYSITAGFASGFSGFGIGDPGSPPPSGPLPVELLAFEARQVESDVSLRWTTVEEINSHAFEIQRSRDMEAYYTVATIPAAGNSSDIRHYTCRDEGVPGGVFYYKLKMVDLDGQYEYSNVVVVEVSGTLAQLRVYPNPVTDLVRVEYTSRAGGNLAYGIYNISGIMVKSGYWDTRRGTNSKEISFEDLEAGLYIVEIQDGNEKKRVKLTRR